MPKIQIITDGHPNNTTLIIDGVDITSQEDIGWIIMEAFGRDPLQIRQPYFKLQYSSIEKNALDPKVIETSVKTIVVGPDEAGSMHTSIQ